MIMHYVIKACVLMDLSIGDSLNVGRNLQGYKGKAREGNLNMHKKLATATEAIFTFDNLALCRVLFSKLPFLSRLLLWCWRSS